MNKWTDKQLEAINTKGSNIIVSAGAGSGKTAVLTERVIVNLKNNIHINELLILTFTENAAKEMKNRIKKAIIDNGQLKEELNFIDSASITTFDAFVLSLVKKYHYYLNIDSDISIIDSSIINEKKKIAINEIFNEYYKKNDSKFLKLVKDFNEKNDKSIKKTILLLDKQIDLLANKEGYLKDYLNYYFCDTNIEILFEEYNKLLLQRIDSIRNALNNLSYEVTEKYYEKIYDALTTLLNAKNYDEIRLSLTDLKLPNLTNATLDAKHYKEEISGIKKDLNVLCQFSKKDLISDLLKTKDYVEIIINILIELNNRINNFKINKNKYEFNDISKFAIKLLKENNNLRDEIKKYYKEIMIDEYQDTSDIEEEFISLIDNNNIYMVGDIKQSIYRFRNANPNIFKNKYDKYQKNDGGIKIDLNKNFRSRDNVLNSINEIFNHLMDDTIGNANYKNEHQLIFGNLLFNTKGNNNYNNNLEIYNYENDDSHPKDVTEAFIIVNDIKNKINNKYLIFDQKLRPCEYKDFCILMDRTTSFETYIKVFDYYKIPLNIYKDEDVLLSDETYLIKNILGLIINCQNKIMDETTNFYYASIARSYLFNINDNEIYNIITTKKIKESEIYKICKEISLNINYLSNKNIINLIIEKFDFYQKMISVGDINHRTVILDFLLNKSEELNSIGDNIYDFIDYLDSLLNDDEEIKLPAIINDNNSVTITNIHKSKGLEYKICYYSGLYKEFNMQDIKKRIRFSNKYGIIIPAYENGFKETFVSFLNKEKYKEEEISEKLRLFYVALTRCQEKMIIITNLNKDTFAKINENDVIDYLDRINIKSFKDALDTIYKYIDKYTIDVKAPFIDDKYNLKREIKIKDNRTFEKLNITEKEIDEKTITENHYSKVSAKLLTKEEKENMEYGIHIHYILENLDFNNPNLEVLNVEDKNIVLALLQSKIMNNINKAQIYKEYPFIDEKNSAIKTGVIDLMLEYCDHIDIIDYKLKHTDDPAYLEQLNGYKDYIQNKAHKKTNIYLYSLLDKNLIPL